MQNSRSFWLAAMLNDAWDALRYRLKPFGPALVCGVAATSCVSHMHSDADAKNAADAQAKLAELTAAAPQSYAAMGANLERFKAEEEYLMKEVNATALSALGTKLPSMTWKEVFDRVKTAQDSTSKFADEIATEAQTYRAGTKDWNAKAADAKKAVTAANKQLSDAKGRVAAWNKSIAVLQQSISDTQANLAKMSKDASFDTLLGIAADAADEQVTYRDADGKDQKVGVLDALDDDLTVIITAFRRKDAGGGAAADKQPGKKPSFWTKVSTARKGLLPDAPGIAVVLANLVLDTAKVRQSAAESELNYLEQRAHLFEDAYAQMVLARQVAEEMKREMMGPDGKLDTGKYLADRNIFNDLINDWHENAEDTPQKYVDARAKVVLLIQKQKGAGLSDEEKKELSDAKALLYNRGPQVLELEDSNAEKLNGLRKLAVAENIILRNRTLFRVSCARLAHQHSIDLSALADQAHQSLFKATMSGLSAYHDGGMKSEDVANFINLAQAVGLGFIAKNVH